MTGCQKVKPITAFYNFEPSFFQENMMGVVLKADFKRKIDSRLSSYDPNKKNWEYQSGIFVDMFNLFPQFKDHVAAYVERNYCCVVNDEDHGDPRSLFTFLKEEEVWKLNHWILNRRNRAFVIK